MKRSKFSLSHYKLLTMNMGNLVPLTWYEVLPGDTIQGRTSALIRVSPLAYPVMHPVQVRIHNWFVPLRKIWDDSGGANTGFEDFITGGSDGTATPTVPYIDNTAVAEGSLFDYLDWPYSAAYGYTLAASALPVRAYQWIFSEFYRDQDLVTAPTIDTTNGTDTTTTSTLQRVAWAKDYFSCARDELQKGVAQTVSLGSTAPLAGLQYQNVADTGTMLDVNDGTAGSSAANSRGVSIDVTVSGHPKAWVDLSSATGISINDLRLSAALQRYMENRAKFGSRYSEYLKNAFGVTSADHRRDRPQYLSGGRQTISFSEVLSTSDSGTLDVGDMRGHGIAAIRSNKFRRFFDEHGLIMTLMSVVPKAIYAQSVNKKFLRWTKEDYLQKELIHVGDMAIQNKEVYCDHTTPDGYFGYQERYDSYRTIPSSVSGEFSDTLKDWHMARIFASDPALNSSFVSCTPTDRVYQSTANDQLYVMANHNIQARRCLPRHAPNKIV